METRGEKRERGGEERILKARYEPVPSHRHRRRNARHPACGTRAPPPPLSPPPLSPPPLPCWSRFAQPEIWEESSLDPGPLTGLTGGQKEHAPGGAGWRARALGGSAAARCGELARCGEQARPPLYTSTLEPPTLDRPPTAGGEGRRDAAVATRRRQHVNLTAAAGPGGQHKPRVVEPFGGTKAMARPGGPPPPGGAKAVEHMGTPAGPHGDAKVARLETDGWRGCT